MVPMVDAQPRETTIEANAVRIVDAYYGDLDGDAFEDDIKILVGFSFASTDIVRIEISLWVELPSGLTYFVKILVFGAPGQSIVNIDCIDMATESGWYTVYMLASIKLPGFGKVYIVDSIEFDPPTGTGNGMPTVIAYF